MVDKLKDKEVKKNPTKKKSSGLLKYMEKKPPKTPEEKNLPK